MLKELFNTILANQVTDPANSPPVVNVNLDPSGESGQAGAPPHAGTLKHPPKPDAEAPALQHRGTLRPSSLPTLLPFCQLTIHVHSQLAASRSSSSARAS